MLLISRSYFLRNGRNAYPANFVRIFGIFLFEKSKFIMQTSVKSLSLAEPWIYQILRKLAQISFILTIILIPFRLRTVIQSRPTPPLYSDYTDFLFFPADGFMLLTVSFWAFSLLIHPRKISLGARIVTLPLAGVTVMGWISTLFSLDPALSLYHAVRMVFLLFFYFYLLNEVSSPLAIIPAAAIQIAIQAIVGSAQVLEQHSIGLKLFGEHELDPAWHGISIYSINGVRWLRAYGLSDHPNILGGCLALGLLLLLFAASRRYTWRTMLVSGVFILGIETLFQTFSRSAWLAFTSGVVFFAASLWLTRRRLDLWRTGVLLFSSGLIILPILLFHSQAIATRLLLNPQSRNNPQEDQSIGERQLLNRSARLVFAENALTGIGLGALPRAMRDRLPEFQVNYQPAHLVLLVVAAETGIVGASFYTLLLVLPWLALWFHRRQLRFTSDLAIASALMLAVGVLGLLDYYTWLLVPGRLWQWIIWGSWAQAYFRSRIDWNTR